MPPLPVGLTAIRSTMIRIHPSVACILPFPDAHVTLCIDFEDGQPIERIRLEGRLSREVLSELERVIEGTGPSRLRIDVTHLLSADPEGVAALMGLRARGAEIQGASPYLRILMGERVE